MQVFEYESSKYVLLFLAAAIIIFITSRRSVKQLPTVPFLQPDRWQRATYISNQPDGLDWKKYRYAGKTPQHLLWRMFDSKCIQRLSRAFCAFSSYAYAC